MQLELSSQFLKNTRRLNFMKVKMFLVDEETDGRSDRDRQADTRDEANRHFCILHLYLKSKYGVKAERANISKVTFFLTFEVVGLTPDSIARFVK